MNHGGEGKSDTKSNVGATARVHAVAKAREVAVVKKTHRWTGDRNLEGELVGFASQPSVKAKEAEGIRNDPAVSSQSSRQMS